ncbi:MAG: restriction endonuclease subunit S [Methylococcales bacterium]
MSDLPKEWVNIYLQDIGTWGSGGTPKKSNIEYYDGVIPWLVIGDLNDSVVNKFKSCISELGLKNSSAKLLAKGTILIGMYGSIGKLGITGFECATNQAMASCVVNNQIIVSKLFFYYIWSRRDHLLSLGKGGAQQNISQTVLKAYEISLPPLKEQIQIANKLDELLAKVDTTKSHLDKIPTILKCFRQSVLADAISGKLTQEWREANVSDDWTIIKLDKIAKVVDPQPSHRTPPEHAGGIPYIGIGDISLNGEFNFDRAKKVSPEVLKEHNKRYQLKEGDFVFGKIGTLGKATLVPIGIDYTLSANVILIQPDISQVESSYIRFFLQAPDTMKEVAKQSNSTSQAAFGIKKMRAFKFTLPGQIEQKEIVHRVEILFTLADNIEKQYQTAKAKVDKLTQSILAKAFRGKLTAKWRKQNPDLISGKNSAQALIEKVKLGKEALKPVKKAKRKRKV